MIELIINAEEEYCEICCEFKPKQNVHNGYCETCRPICKKSLCGGLLVPQNARFAVCGKCNALHELNERGLWQLKNW